MVTAVLVTVVLAACTPTPEPMQPPVVVPPAQYKITADDLPEGWRVSNPGGEGYRTTFCGVDLEPVAPVKTVRYRFTRSPVGPFLEQHVRAYADDTAAEVIAAIQAALPTCRESEAVGDGTNPSVRFTVEALTLSATAGADADTVAWRQQPVGGGVVSEIVLTRRGAAAVLLMAYSVRGDPDRSALEAALAAVPR